MHIFCNTIASDAIGSRGCLSTSDPIEGANSKQQKLLENEYIEIGSKLSGNSNDTKRDIDQASALAFHEVKK
ncbi:hypothetical protein HDV04_002099 [Boothiomyces sp. JEL0838]|nr:hypothetical protein HDV04_002099 [Boothiomyces sp. JEL0838]